MYKRDWHIHAFNGFIYQRQNQLRTWSLGVCESHPLQLIPRDQRWAVTSCIVWFTACLQLWWGQSPLIAETDNCVLLILSIALLHTSEAFQCGERAGGSGKCTQPESLWQRTIQTRWSNSRKGMQSAASVSQADTPLEVWNILVSMWKWVSSLRISTVAHLFVLASDSYFGCEMTACG